MPADSTIGIVACKGASLGYCPDTFFAVLDEQREFTFGTWSHFFCRDRPSSPDRQRVCLVVRLHGPARDRGEERRDAATIPGPRAQRPSHRSSGLEQRTGLMRLILRAAVGRVGTTPRVGGKWLVTRATRPIPRTPRRPVSIIGVMRPCVP